MDNINSTIPDTWELIKLGEITTYTKGYAFKSINYISEGTRVIRISDTNAHSIKEENPIFISNEDGQYDKWKLIENDLVFTTVGSKPPMYDSMVGKVIKVHKKQEGALLNQNAVILRGLKSKVNQHYLYHNFKLKKYLNFIETIVRGNANQVSITLKELFNYVIPLPPLKEQKKIAEILSQWDEAIETTQNLIEKLQVRKKGLMQELLSGKKRLPGFSEEWELTELKTHLIKHSEVSTESSQYPVLTSSRRGIFFQTDYYTREVASKDNTGYNVVPRGYFTYRHMSDDLIFKFNINTLCDKGIVSTLYPVFTTKETLEKEYLLNVLNEGEEFKRYALKQKQGGSRTYMYFGKLEKLRIPLPKIEEQRAIINFINTLQSEIDEYNNLLRTQEEQKKGLMQQLLTGKKRVTID
ncbi:restriction endonuclease subunit S [Polaribacter sp. HaHaR_3_91]|uniref:restriction endonuclease subunit S n=1 Tax=Polaribacter sp. HaHaR_3_91 TaxID=2745561 RepID=UPI001C4E40A5|nr:restriction endonuclease subunit S [Polaribacter sp. HaHaR_3_91]QXP64352.1 restriction endonuclease subunit S [Polaribacter sp. HaHaR_3_91]